MLSLNTNNMALFAQDQRRKTSSQLSTAIERLSSGLRINSAADDAAGVGIANRMTANLRAASAVIRGVNDGISLMQVAEGGLNSINDILHRARELALLAANGAMSDVDRASIDREYKMMRDEIDRISRATEAFDIHPLAPAKDAEQPVKLGEISPLKEKFPVSGGSATFSSGIVSMAYIPAGAKNVVLSIDSLGMDDDIQLFSREGGHLVGTPIEGVDADYVWTSRGVTDAATANKSVLTEANGFLPGAAYSAATLLEGGPVFNGVDGASSTYKGMTFVYSGDGDRYEDDTNGGYNDGRNGPALVQRLERLHIDDVTEDLIVMVIGNGSFTGTASWDVMPEPTEPVPPPPPPHSTATDIVVSARYGGDIEKITISATPADTVSLGIHDTHLDPRDEALKAIAVFDRALSQVDGYRGQYGALTNRFDAVIAGLRQEEVTLSSARSRIMDADYAVEVSNMTRAQILMQASTAVLAQSNQLPEGILKLFEGA